MEDEDARRDEDESIDAIFKAEVESFVKRKAYKSSKGKTYATLWRQCQLTLQTKIQNQHAFDIKIKSDPIQSSLKSSHLAMMRIDMRWLPSYMS